MTNPPPAARFRPVVLIVAVAAFAALAGWFLLRPVAVVAVVTSGPVTQAVPGGVTVRAAREVQLRNELAGRVARSELVAGRVVQAGETLLMLDTGALALDIQGLEAELATQRRLESVGSPLEPELAAARASLAEAVRAQKLGGVSDAEVTRQSLVAQRLERELAVENETRAARLASLENQLAQKRRELGQATLTAPFDGAIAAVTTTPGDWLPVGTPVATLISRECIVEARLSEEYFAGLRVGQSATVRFLGYGGELHTAQVERVLPSSDPVTQRYTVVLKVQLPAEKLVPGLTGEVSIVTAQREAAAIVPRRALRGDIVLVADNGQVEERRVKVGFAGLERAEILEGLRPGEHVIVEELERFAPGSRVRLKEVR